MQARSIVDITVSITAILRPAKRLVYGIYAWSSLTCVVIPTILALAFLPGVRRRRRFAHWAARLFFLCIGSPIRVRGSKITGSCVVVANHSSYLDGIILTAALPPQFTFVIKREMEAFPVAGFVLRRLGSEFVARDDERDRKRVTRRLFNAAHAGDAIAFFPEGTFDLAPGLKRFRPGAFGAAWRGGKPIFPVVISGARAKLPAETFFPSPGPLSVRVCEPLHPDEQESAESLMAVCRRAMLEHLGEPDAADRGVTSDHPWPG